MAIEYQKGNSFLHNLDARTKLLIFIGATVISMIIIDPILMGIFFLILYFLGRNAINKDLLNNNLKILVVIFLTFSMFQVLWFTPKDSYFLFYLIPGKNWVPVTVQGIIRGIAVFFRFFSVVLAVHLMLYTTPPVELALTITERGQERKLLASIGITLALGAIFFISALPKITENSTFLGIQNTALQYGILAAGCLGFAFAVYKVLGRGLPAEMGVALMLGFATVGILSTQTQQITNAQKARGYDVQPKNLIARVKVLTALLIPIFLATLERSQDISIAILSRGFDYNISERTYRREFSFRRNDYIVLSIMLLIIIAGLLMAHFGVSSPTESLILKTLP
ncbi:MAG: energy-coupling factor transporter transmembrane protein EcfT [Anaerolineaceae bacterium]|nr:energy-coupling factor transporter transmembrane protein EcfT [Anaerolineaceae bacterium]